MTTSEKHAECKRLHDYLCRQPASRFTVAEIAFLVKPIPNLPIGGDAGSGEHWLDPILRELRRLCPFPLVDSGIGGAT